MGDIMTDQTSIQTQGPWITGQVGALATNWAIRLFPKNELTY